MGCPPSIKLKLKKRLWNKIHCLVLTWWQGMLFCLAVQNLGHPYWLTLAPMYIWFLIFFIQPHKEERFLFPVYPLICLCGAVSLSALQVSFWEMFACLFLFHFWHDYLWNFEDRWMSVSCRSAGLHSALQASQHCSVWPCLSSSNNKDPYEYRVHLYP